MNFKTFDLNLLRVLDAVLREGSTTRAGARLGLTQSAVSNGLRRLRDALGDELFIRRGNRLVPTDFAARLQHDLSAELARIETLLSPAAEFDPATAQGTFKIAGSDFFCDLLMPELGKRLREKAPGIRAQLVDLVPHDYLLSLDQAGGDLALIPDRDLPEWVCAEPVFTSAFSVIARAGHPGLADVENGQILPLDLFCALPHVLFSPEGRLEAMGDAALAKIGKKRQVAMTLPVFSGVCRAVGASDMIALVPAQLADAMRVPYGLRVFAPPMPIAPAQIIGVWPKTAQANPLARWMRAQVFDILSALDSPPRG